LRFKVSIISFIFLEGGWEGNKAYDTELSQVNHMCTLFMWFGINLSCLS